MLNTAIKDDAFPEAPRNIPLDQALAELSAAKD